MFNNCSKSLTQNIGFWNIHCFECCNALDNTASFVSNTTKIWTFDTIKIKKDPSSFLLTATPSPVFTTGIELPRVMCISYLFSFISYNYPSLKYVGGNGEFGSSPADLVKWL